MEQSILVLATGFLAQAFFSARTLVQWILSERAKKVLSPSLFWVLSLAGAYLLCVYGWMRDDFAIVLGQIVSYYVYLWNLKLKGVWTRVPDIFRIILLATPIVAFGWEMGDAVSVAQRFFLRDDMPLWLLLFGTGGQLLFTLRFVYQWVYSHKQRESVLPTGFWVISLAGALSIVTYAIIRHDIVLIVGQSTGLIVYIRNLAIIHKGKKSQQ
ncbi:MAG: lipid-A-disaccharide synthase N-terminal domain-containing protein [Marinilabiliaceae bacterium]